MSDDARRVELLPGRSGSSWGTLYTTLIFAIIAAMILVVVATWPRPSWLWVPLSWLVLFGVIALTLLCGRRTNARVLAEAAHGYTTNQDDFNHDYVDRKTGAVLRRAGILATRNFEVTLPPLTDEQAPLINARAYRAGYLATVFPFGVLALLLSAMVVYLLASGDAADDVGMFLVFLAMALGACVGDVVMVIGQLQVRRFLSSDVATGPGTFAFTSDVEPVTYTAAFRLGVKLKARQIGTVLSSEGIAIYPDSESVPVLQVSWRDVTRVQVVTETGTSEKDSWLYIGFEHPRLGELFLAWGSLQVIPWTLRTRKITQRVAGQAQSRLIANGATSVTAAASDQ